MQQFLVSLSSITDVKHFVDAATHCPCEIDVLSERYVIDAKSIMGLFSLDLAHPVTVEFHGDQAQYDAFRACVATFMVDD